MSLPFARRIRETLHGTTDLTQLECHVVDHPYFQRLRRIKQTAFLSLIFPGATHTRFEHSLGVLHLANRAWNKLKENQIRLKHQCDKIPYFYEYEKSSIHGVLSDAFQCHEELFASQYIAQAFRIAAMCHDLGHPPFSHSGEIFLPTIQDLVEKNDLPEYLRSFFQKQLLEKQRRNANHEDITLVLLDHMLSELYNSFPLLPLKVEPQDVLAILNLDISIKKDSPLEKLRVRELTHELISGEVDIDRMDYLLRDSKECGVAYGIFDLDRILDSLCFSLCPKTKTFHLNLLHSGLSAFEDYLRARQSMYLQSYFHKTGVACEAMLRHLKDCLGEWTLSPSAGEYTKLDEWNIGPQLISFAQSKGVDLGAEVETLVTNLIYHRKLWKRIYESISMSQEIEQDGALEKLERELTQKGVPFVKISTSNSLAKLNPQKKGEKKQNPLKLIVKDPLRIPKVYPIEEYSPIYSTNSYIQITRVYCGQMVF